MIQDEKPRSGYQERLLGELRALAERNAAEAPAARRRGGIASRPKLALAGVAGSACVASAVFAFAGSDDGSTAYAVVPHDDGSVTVEISKLQDAAELERELREAGVPAEVDYLPLGQMCQEGRFKPAPAGGRSSLGMSEVADGGPVTFTVGANNLRPGQTLVITSSGGEQQGATSVTTAVAQGEVAPCEPVAAPALPDAGGAPAAPRLDESGGSAGGSDESGTTEDEE
jgi:hypothetical protein